MDNTFRLNRVLLLLTLLAVGGNAQNLDFITRHVPGPNQGLGGAGIGSAQGISALDINPAGLAVIKGTSVSASMSGHLHTYSLINERKEEALTRIFKWNKLSQTVNRVALRPDARSDGLHVHPASL
ncbi:MAG: hypothetical protein K9M49_05045 [Candidatus Marinimicrobia bacterium]|nr:hypothetical protein [Candidatus Neomarinimicrobiota bacterium]MCF7904502.1 hypothetical protein [Candidatus Neomarinimicrobiota bacterium]